MRIRDLFPVCAPAMFVLPLAFELGQSRTMLWGPVLTALASNRHGQHSFKNCADAGGRRRCRAIAAVDLRHVVRSRRVARVARARSEHGRSPGAGGIASMLSHGA